MSSTCFASSPSSFAAISAADGSRPVACSSARRVRETLFMRSTMCTGIRIVRDWSASARVIAWRIHQVA